MSLADLLGNTAREESNKEADKSKRGQDQAETTPDKRPEEQEKAKRTMRAGFEDSDSGPDDAAASKKVKPRGGGGGASGRKHSGAKVRKQAHGQQEARGVADDDGGTPAAPKATPPRAGSATSPGQSADKAQGPRPAAATKGSTCGQLQAAEAEPSRPGRRPKPLPEVVDQQLEVLRGRGWVVGLLR